MCVCVSCHSPRTALGLHSQTINLRYNSFFFFFIPSFTFYSLPFVFFEFSHPSMALNACVHGGCRGNTTCTGLLALDQRTVVLGNEDRLHLLQLPDAEEDTSTTRKRRRLESRAVEGSEEVGQPEDEVRAVFAPTAVPLRNHREFFLRHRTEDSEASDSPRQPLSSVEDIVGWWRGEPGAEEYTGISVDRSGALLRFSFRRRGPSMGESIRKRRHPYLGSADPSEHPSFGEDFEFECRELSGRRRGDAVSVPTPPPLPRLPFFFRPSIFHCFLHHPSLTL